MRPFFEVILESTGQTYNQNLNVSKDYDFSIHENLDFTNVKTMILERSARLSRKMIKEEILKITELHKRRWFGGNAHRPCLCYAPLAVQKAPLR